MDKKLNKETAGIILKVMEDAKKHNIIKDLMLIIINLLKINF
ncbi:MAG: hypothetical protein PHS04_14190 [Tissierellia bacterium]|nr:hypothetical protein [Tissierellia bacterium]